MFSDDVVKEKAIFTFASKLNESEVKHALPMFPFTSASLMSAEKPPHF